MRISPRAILEENEQFIHSKGALTENYVYTQLIAMGIPAYYWRSDANAELDYLIERDARIIPIEVKSADNTFLLRMQKRRVLSNREPGKRKSGSQSLSLHRTMPQVFETADNISVCLHYMATFYSREKIADYAERFRYFANRLIDVEDPKNIRVTDLLREFSLPACICAETC